MRHHTVGGGPLWIVAWRPTRRLITLLTLGGLPLILYPGSPEAFGLTLLLAGPLLVLAFIDAMILWRASRNLEAHRQHDFRLSIGEANPIRISVRNRSGMKLVGEVTDDVPQGFSPQLILKPLRLSPFGRAVIRYTTEPHQRGDHRFGSIWLRLRSRMALMAIQAEVPASSEVPVYPNLRALQRYRLLARHRISLAGLHRIRGSARGGEFDRLRDYAPDDRYHDIDWKATARRDRPVIRITRPERGQQVLLAIDTGRSMAARIGHQTRLDAALSSALLLADVALSQNDRVGLCLFSHQVQHYLKPACDPSALSRFLSRLYAAHATYSATSYLAWARWLAPRLHRRTLVVIWTDLSDEATSQELNTALSVLLPRHLPIVVSLRDRGLESLAWSNPAETRGLYQRAVASELMIQQSALIRRLRQGGSHVLHADVERLSIEVIGEYVDTKLKGRL